MPNAGALSWALEGSDRNNSLIAVDVNNNMRNRLAKNNQGE